jgi:SAM-dependent methyltransferase
MTEQPNLDRLVSAAAVDFGRRAADYALHRPGPPKEVCTRLQKLLSEVHQRRSGEGEWVAEAAADLGAGPGHFGADLLRFGLARKVYFVDLAPEQLEHARERAREAIESRGESDHDRTEICCGSAADLVVLGVPESSLDLVCASTAWPWFPQPEV